MQPDSKDLPQATNEFDWKTVDPSKILVNPKYQELFRNHAKRNGLLNEAFDRSQAEGQVVWEKIRRQEDLDESDKLTTEREKQEYLHWFVKFKHLEEVKESLDPGIYPILYQFNRLPFSSLSSDTGHIVEGTNRLEEDWLPVLTFLGYKDLSEEEQAVQREFLRGITSLNIAICERLGIEPYNLLDLRGYLVELEDGEVRELSIQETLNEGLEMTLYLNVPDDSLNKERGAEVMTTLWQEFYKYVNSFLGEEKSVPDFEEGKMFTRVEDKEN